MGEVIKFGGLTTLDVPVDRVIEEAAKAKLTEVIIIGVDEDGYNYFSSSVADGKNILWDIEQCKKRLLAIGDE
jgi:basic membrane lipoprotein Med (substrate-binding protein (PBP1-ABC) superfamily)